MKQNELTPDSVNTILGPETLFEGNVHFNGSIRIDGKIIGSLEGKGNSEIGANGTIKGDITVKNLYIAGTVLGNVNSSGKVEVLSSATVIGDISAASIQVSDGAAIDGRIFSISEERKNAVLEKKEAPEISAK